MKTVFAALNAKYIHTNLAIRSVKAYAAKHGLRDITLWERTINHRYRQLLRELAAFDAGLVIFSCYIWNIELIRRLAEDLRTLRPEVMMGAAGPEVTYGSEDFLRDNPAFDFVLSGEGEETTCNLLRRLEASPERVIGVIRPDQPPDPDTLPFAYEDLSELKGRLVYYESMRGCPFRCSYCLSSVEDGVRFRDLAPVFSDLDRFLAAKVPQVKLVDRTFNCDRKRALAIWRYLREQDNGVTNFHFELAGELLDEETIEFLSTIRPGQFQFEIGVQSTNPATLAAISRPADPARLFTMVRQLQRPRNIHLHLDLIAGLPLEDYPTFGKSFNDVYSLQPHQFQPGFLKCLKGSAMRRNAAQYGILHQAAAPYEVLRTNALSFARLSRLHQIADLVDTYYNSGRFRHLLAEMLKDFPSPFAFYEALADFFVDHGFDQSPVSKIGYYDLLGQFLTEHGIPITARHQWLCRYDLALHEKIRKAPQWVTVDGASPHRHRILAFLSSPENQARYIPQHQGLEPKQIIKLAPIEVFPFHPETGEETETAILFHYNRRDILGRAGTDEIDLDDS